MSHQPLTELMPLERIHTVAPDMSKTHKKIAEYILENYESASFLTSVALADKLALASAGRYATPPGADAGKVKCVGAVSNGDAVSFYQLAEAEGWTKDNKNLARYVG